MSVSPCCNALLRRVKPSFLTHRVLISCRENFLLRNKSKSTSDVTSYVDDEYLNPHAPVKFSTSRAAQWKAQYKKIIQDPQSLEDDDESFRQLMYGLAFTTLVIYAFLRGKNEWDDEMAMPLGKRMLVLREYQARNEMKAAIENREDITDIKQQLEKIAQMRKEYHYD